MFLIRNTFSTRRIPIYGIKYCTKNFIPTQEVKKPKKDTEVAKAAVNKEEVKAPKKEAGPKKPEVKGANQEDVCEIKFLGDPLYLEPMYNASPTLKQQDNIRRQKVYNFGLYVAACNPKFVEKIVMHHNGTLEILVAPDGIFQVLSFLRYHQHACFEQCSAVTAIDVPSRAFRFEVIYLLLSMRFAERVTVKTYTDEVTALPSSYSLWRGNNWFEREVYDMFGVIFSDHPDLRRLLTDYGFPSHPLRKDFPQVGYTECRYDDELKKIVYEPVEFAQEYRAYKVASPWSSMKNFNIGFNSPPPPPPPPPAPPKKK